MSTVRYALHLVWLNAGFYTGLVLLTATGIVFVFFPVFTYLHRIKGYDKGTSMRRLVWYYGQAWSWLLRLFVPVYIENCTAPLPRPCIITPNHQSFFDTYCFGFMPEPEVVFAVRAWPFRIPFYGPFMRLAEYLNTEGDSVEKLLAQSKAIIDKGASIAIFPEGHRSPERKMQRFHSGAFYLAVNATIPVLPVCIDGTGAFLRKGSFLLRPTTIRLRVLSPIHPQDFARYGDEAPLQLRHAVKDALQHCLDDFATSTRV